MQNDNILHSTLIAPFIQEYPSPLQTIIKPLHPCDAPLSSLYRWKSTEPRRVSLTRSQELVTQLKASTASAAQFRQAHGLWLQTHRSQGSTACSFSLCPPTSSLSLFTIASLSPNVSKARWRPSREQEDLHIPHFPPCVFSKYSGSHAQLNRGRKQSKV